MDGAGTGPIRTRCVLVWLQRLTDICLQWRRFQIWNPWSVPSSDDRDSVWYGTRGVSIVFAKAHHWDRFWGDRLGTVRTVTLCFSKYTSFSVSNFVTSRLSIWKLYTFLVFNVYLLLYAVYILSFGYSFINIWKEKDSLTLPIFNFIN